MYTTTRDVQPDEEPRIANGPNPLVPPISTQSPKNKDPILQTNEISTGTQSAYHNHEVKNPFLNGDPNQVIPPEALPFTKLKPPPDEEDPQTIRTINAWVVDVPDPQHISTLLKWLKQSHLDTPDLNHLKRIRKQNDSTTFLISLDTIEPPPLPLPTNLPAPYIISVPASSALTPTSLALKSSIWPTIYTPRRKDEPEPWTRGQLSWAWNAMNHTVHAAIKAAEDHQLPIAAHIPTPHDTLIKNPTSFTASDTRNSSRNPLRHSILSVIRKIADHQTSPPSPSESASKAATNYLLTDQTVFVTHEPCIMCSMALLHSRVKQVVYLYPMPKTGGCGGCACLPALKGVNHRFGIFHWKSDKSFFSQNDTNIAINDTVDS